MTRLGKLRCVSLGLAVLVYGCHTPRSVDTPTRPDVMGLPMPGTDGRVHGLQSMVRSHTWTVLLFFSYSCPTVDAHTARVNALSERYAPLGIGFYWLDSEAHADLERNKTTAKNRGYAIPILTDEGAVVADALGARYASHAFILNAQGEVVYSGGIDSDKRTLHADATPYLANALERVLNGAVPDPGDGRALGCALQR